MSEIIIPARTSAETNMLFARTRFTSYWVTASYISLPIPGYEKIISKIKLPLKRLARRFALPVIYGLSVFLKAWFK